VKVAQLTACKPRAASLGNECLGFFEGQQPVFDGFREQSQIILYFVRVPNSSLS
jgi:hypothetical protein